MAAAEEPTECIRIGAAHGVGADGRGGAEATYRRKANDTVRD